MFDLSDFDGHERIMHVHDCASGLKAIIALHSTRLGPAAGGCRLWRYDSPHAALADVLRLSRGMSYKNALAGLPMGGGKAVILGPVAPELREAQFRAFGRAVDGLGGAYVTAEDVGVSVADMALAAHETAFVSGLSDAGGIGGDPSPHTARGVRLGIEAVARVHLGRRDLQGLTIAVQGLGNVGFNLCRELHAQGARLIVADIQTERVQAAMTAFGARTCPANAILGQEADILAPCALGGVITEAVARTLRVKAVAGGANNQLANDAAGQILLERGIAFAPDYVINAGGIIVVAAEYFGGAQASAAADRIAAIHARTAGILQRAAHEAAPPHRIADAMAREIIAAG